MANLSRDCRLTAASSCQSNGPVHVSCDCSAASGAMSVGGPRPNAASPGTGMTSRPIVSICIPVFNGEAYLRDCLESALSQTHSNFELVVVDDGSTDGTVAIVEDYIRHDSRIALYRNGRNLGLVANWNRCVALSHGEWVKFLFQDDFLQPLCLEGMLASRRPGVPLIVCRRDAKYEGGVAQEFEAEYARCVAVWDIARQFPGHLLVTADDFAAYMLRNPVDNCIGEPTATLVHRSAFDQFGLFNPRLIQIPDWEHAAKIAVGTGFCYVDEPLATFRVHGAGCTAKNKTTRRYRSDVIDPLILRCELAYSEAFAAVRAAGRRCTPHVDLERQFIDAVYKARLLVESYAKGPARPDPSALQDWEEAVRQLLPANIAAADAARLQRELADRKNELAVIKGSISWRLTTPIRFVGRARKMLRRHAYT